jgi:hypothetical protein
VLIIDLLEVIDIDQHDAHRRAVASRARQLAMQEGDNLSAIPDSSQKIVAGRKLQGVVGREKFLLQLDDSPSHLQPCLQLQRIERFREKIVRARIHRFQHLLLSSFRRQQNRVSVRLVAFSLTSQSPTQFHAIDLRKHPVQKRQPRRILFGQRLPRFLPVGYTHVFKSPFLQMGADQAPVDWRILRQQDGSIANFGGILSRFFTPVFAFHRR